MKEDESISEFNYKLCNIANEVFALEEKYSKEKLVCKVLRSLPKRFSYKITTIKEAKDVQNIKLKELMDSLHTFEINLDKENEEKKDKRIAFQVEIHMEERDAFGEKLG